MHQPEPSSNASTPACIHQILLCGRSAIALDPHDERSHYALGHALQDQGHQSEAFHVFQRIAAKVNPKSAQAYWAMGRIHAKNVDEWDSDPDDPNDPSHFYQMAAQLQPTNFKPDGTRVRVVEPKTPESEARQESEAKTRRAKLLEELKDGTRTLKYADEL